MPLVGIRFDKKAAGPFHVRQQLGGRVEDHNVEELIPGQRLRNSVRNQVQSSSQRPHRRRHQPHEEYCSGPFFPPWYFDIDKVSKGQVGARLEAFAKLAIHLVLEGSVTFTVGEESFALGPGALVVIPDPAVRRGAVGETAGATVLAVGNRRADRFESTWNPEHFEGVPTHDRPGE